jgi:hypothetical protein
MCNGRVGARKDEVVGVLWSGNAKIAERIVCPELIQSGAIAPDKVPVGFVAHIKASSGDYDVDFFFTFNRKYALLCYSDYGTPSGFDVVLLQSLQITITRRQATATNSESRDKTINQLRVLAEALAHNLVVLAIKLLLLWSADDHGLEELIKSMPSVKALAPWEGRHDVYRDTLGRGGRSHNPSLHRFLLSGFAGANSVENMPEMFSERPFLDDY